MKTPTATELRACEVCTIYWARRTRPVVLAAAILAARKDISLLDLAARYRVSVHRRHLAGKCLSTRPRTPNQESDGGGTIIHVTRCCNGCGTDLGDAREDELEAAVAGAQLPDARLECGCHGRDVIAA